MFFFIFNELVQVKLGASPKEADVAIVSINSGGTVGELNQMVIKEYGYNKSILKQLNLEKGFDLFQLNGKAILFVVTVGIGNPINNLHVNLRQAITFYFELLSNKKIWIPLMATGSGKASYLDSYKVTTNILEDLKDFIHKFNCEFIISLPNDKKGEAFYQQIKKGFDNSISNEEHDKLNSKLQIDSVKNNSKEVTNLIELLNASYHFVGIDWEGKNQIKRFFKDGIWETGFSNRLTGIIKNIRVDDILFIKEPLRLNNENYFKILAIGKVTSNPMNGRKVIVDWLIKDIFLEIKALGYNNSTITNAQSDSVKEIFSKINVEDFKILKSSLNIGKRKKHEIIEDSEIEKLENNPTSDQEIKPYTKTLPGILCDSETGEDHLDIKKDVEAFARVIGAKSFTPPLAIALLGKWGSGKSFFMQKLKEDIQKLSANNPQEAFCEGIAHVHFNAWSYMDANLWASIVTRIFEGLHDYISQDDVASRSKKQIEKQLGQNLNISKEQIAVLESQKENLEEQLNELNKKKDKVQSDLNEEIDQIKLKSIKTIISEIDKDFNVAKRIESALNENPSFIDSKEKFKKIVPEQYWNEPNAIYNQLKSGKTYIKAFFYGKNWWKNWLFLGIVLSIITLTPIFTYLSTLLISWHNFSKLDWVTITIAGSLFTRAIDTYNKLIKLISPFWKIKTDYEKEKEEALFKFQQEEKAIFLKIENNKSKINIITEQINKLSDLKSSIEFKLENAVSTEALYSFIEKRANSDDYKKHLGVVSIIRKDFEVLSGLLTQHHSEIISNKDSEEFRKLFSKPLERIILYIDDLDRCPEERVVEVLEAVNLLMAFPLFVVVVGVDPRWVKNALHKKYQNQFSENVEHEDRASSSNYLEKIFQVPFHLKDADDNSIKNMIEKLAKTKQNLGIINKDKEQENSVSSDSVNIEIVEFDENDKQKISKTLKMVTTPKIEPIINEEQIKALDITDEEIEQIKSLTEIIGNNPRAIKRFVNIYRIVKTHEDFDYNEHTEEKELLTIMFLLALPMGKFKDLMKSFEFFLGNESIGFETLSYYVVPTYYHGGTIEESLLPRKNELNMILQNSGKKALEIDVELFRKHNPFIKRFTFKNI